MQGIYREVQKEYEDNRKKAIDEAESKKNDLYSKFPELKNIDDEIKNIGVQMTKTIIFADNDLKRESEINILKSKIEKLKTDKINILKKLNMDESFFEPHFTCSICQDTGVVGSVEGAKNCTCFRQKVINHTYNSSQINNLEKENFLTFNPELFADEVNKQKYNSDKSPRENILLIKEKAEDFVKNFNNPETKNLLFVGGTGLGKTFLSNSIAKAALDLGKTVLYQTSGRLMDIVMDYRMNRDNETIDTAQYNEIFNVDLLIIDDLGTENMTEARRSELFNILNTRLNLKRKGIKTIISTNKELKDLVSYYDQRIV
jgi:DNA replication protein DnaC